MFPQKRVNVGRAGHKRHHGGQGFGHGTVFSGYFNHPIGYQRIFGKSVDGVAACTH